jgi:uncharacterized protein YeaO (DUF488 family)
MMSSPIVLKRVYEPPEAEDGFRVLVDRLWPRGLSKEKAKIDLWIRDLGPSTALRKWFAHDEQKWEGFREKYLLELEDKQDLLQQLKDLQKEHPKITLLYGARDRTHNEAVIILEKMR